MDKTDKITTPQPQGTPERPKSSTDELFSGLFDAFMESRKQHKRKWRR